MLGIHLLELLWSFLAKDSYQCFVFCFFFNLQFYLSLIQSYPWHNFWGSLLQDSEFSIHLDICFNTSLPLQGPGNG